MRWVQVVQWWLQRDDTAPVATRTLLKHHARNVNNHHCRHTSESINMFKKLCVVIIAFVLLYDVVEGKKTKKSKRPKPEEDNVPQPDVVSYSTFGFNDVGTYEGFVPSSPDYARFLTGANEESSTKQLPSSYPTAIDSTGYGSNFGSQSFDGQSISVSNDGNSQSSIVQYPQNLNGFFNAPSFDKDVAQFKNAPSDDRYGANIEESNAPVYGTKISSKNKFKFGNQFNYSDSELNGDKNEDKFNFNFNNAQQPTVENKPTHNEYHSNSFQNIPSFPSTSVADFGKTAPGDTQNPFKFQRVVDFTKLKPFYPTGIDTSQFPLATPRPDYDTSASAPANNLFTNLYGENTGNNKPQNPTFKEIYEQNTNDEDNNKNSVKSYTYSTKNNINNYSTNTEDKTNINYNKLGLEGKKKLKNRPGSSNYKKWSDPSMKGYEYSTNFSNMSFRYGVDEPKKPFSGGSSIDEIVPASSNLDFPKYQFPEMDYSNFKKIPSYKVHEDNEFDEFPSYKELSPFKEKPSQLEFNQNKHLFSPESTASSYWGNSYKSTDFSLFKNQAKKPFFADSAKDEVVNIQPRRPSKYSSGKPFDSKTQWSQFSRRPSKTRPWNDWSKEVSNKFKSEEDLLGLRNHDTSLPSYLPTYHSNNNYVSDEQDYKKLIDKWRQSYLKSKYKESLRDYESYASEAKPMHVPVPKPYPIEVPHPVIVPVPQPYPVRVPVARPVAVPVIREITIPIEKPVPYAVYKKVPYPIEKLVPVPVEKEVAVPVVKPYPVHVPYVRPVFHHTKTRDEYDSDARDDDDYFPRYENKKQVHYRKKKPSYSNTRERPQDRPRRPSRTVYQDRNRRRWPERQRPFSLSEPRRPHQASYRHRDIDEGYDEERSEYFLYCKKTGKC